MVVVLVIALGARSHSWAIGSHSSSQRGAPAVIAHRGASGHLPEHTLAAYALAYGMGADVIEPDVVLSKDGVLICSHDLTLDEVTDVAQKFAGRARGDGKHYVIDFTLAELRALEKLGREGRVRQHGHGIATLADMARMIQDLNQSTGRKVGIVPEAKSPSFHRAEGMPIEPALLAALRDLGYEGPDDGCLVQCFEIDALERMRGELGTRLPLVWLIGDAVDATALDRAAKVCSGIGPRRTLLFDGDGESAWAVACRARGLAMYPWTFADDLASIATAMRIEGVAGVFTDYPEVGVRARAHLTGHGSDHQHTPPPAP